MFAKFLILTILGMLALVATAQARCGKCDTRLVYHVVVVKKCTPARAMRVRKLPRHRLRVRAIAPHVTARAISAQFAYCPTGYDDLGYACGYPIYVPRPFPYDSSYGLGFPFDNSIVPGFGFRP
ncbi:hypothetical protein GJ654_16720 [Rhodoblastus acidophilus]|uniref:Uncharacterized protein n=1 Tax=Rhodoblastus acidophilus TaxID=1074 RepID=A0A6N8DU10_RHOAC|nr:hypothetical protein [Rhodoblastus acidophilus]MCW2275958.1 hypothetical protein [Rhodoblastus acidophilus]MTV32631.1 hypothetical protein [Rhodoblastus acidophilus]